MNTVHLKNQEEMRAYAHRLAGELAPGTVIGLVGDLGAGKTTFVQYLAEALGVERAVKSPTFILLQQLTTGKSGSSHGVYRLWHADAYRVENERDLWKAGLAEATGDHAALTVVEWADKVPTLKTVPRYREIAITYGEGNERVVLES